jgi:hypothetical protein
MLAGATTAQALITPPVTVDGPSSSIVDFGGVAMASDGSGGVVYVKSVDGTPHVFASRFVDGEWGAPIRVDGDQPYPASQPRIAAGIDGELLVVWVTQVATVHNRIRCGLFAASIGPKASGFGPSELIDPDVGEGIGVDPSVSATAPGQAIVAYRAITYNFDGSDPTPPAQLRPGDVMADIRLARLKEDRWSRLGAINRNPEASLRPPTATNGPEVAASADGGAAVAWQEPDQTGTARVWLRRVFGTTPGPVLEASPASWDGQPVTADADAISLAVSEFAAVRVATRIASEPASVIGGRLLLNSLEPNFSETGGTLTGALLADGGGSGAPPGGIGPPGVAANDDGGAKGSMRLGFLVGSQLHQMAVDADGALTDVPTPPGPVAQAGGKVLTEVDPEGGGLAAYPALDSEGRAAVAVRQEAPSGAAQTGLVSGDQGGPVAGLTIGRSGGGDGLIAFRQGEPGHLQIVAEWVSTRPKLFRASAPSGWIKPARAKLRWEAAPSAAGGIRYSVLLRGHVVKQGLRRLVFRPRPAQLGNGVMAAQVLATDRLGQQLLSPVVRLRVDSQDPIVGLAVHRRRGLVEVRVRDPHSGLKGKRTRVSFGDGTPWTGLRPSKGARRHGHSRHRPRRRSPANLAYRAAHRYESGGSYTIVVRARDRAGNGIVRRFPVRVR